MRKQRARRRGYAAATAALPPAVSTTTIHGGSRHTASRPNAAAESEVGLLADGRARNPLAVALPSDATRLYNRCMPQRLRLTYSRRGAAKYVAHLDIMRTWERAIRRAKLPLAYSQGFSPHARIALAAPLPVGTTGERELMDVWMEPSVEPADACERLRRALPPGLDVLDVEEVGERLPSLQSVVRAARYEVAFEAGAIDVEAVRDAIRELLARDSLDWEEQRGNKTRRYDLRATVIELAIADDVEQPVMTMHLALEDGRTGRPTSVLAALGVKAQPVEVTRTAVEIEHPQVAMRAWRERGRFED